MVTETAGAVHDADGASRSRALTHLQQLAQSAQWVVTAYPLHHFRKKKATKGGLFNALLTGLADQNS